MDVFKEKYDRAMLLVTQLDMPHGTCEPKERNACTHCGAERELKNMGQEWLESIKIVRSIRANM